ncbi:microtubule-associated protein futsch isoform X6 [Euwallacea similis]|uniref:microtubule-associated protein futsch isoform X6 n=1 Tax=Euwallacea similis TaxID=1736056 RepID=UPI00344E5205
MADTVKKSRIVSDEEKDLEEALLEEFNIRLKNCMSQDDLQKEEEPPGMDDTYENLPRISSPQKHIAITQNFLQNEVQENYYDEPKALLRHNGLNEEQIYECIPEKTDNLDQNYVPMVENKTVDLSAPQEYEQMEVGKEITSNLYESVEMRPDEMQQETPKLNLPTTCLTDYSEEKSPEKCSAKDRMFLSCDETSTLLFTQTVTSPMLTPSEENIDFLKGFQRDNTISDETNITPPKEEKPHDNATEEAHNSEENFYENTEFYKNTTPENMYENLMVQTDIVAEPDEGVYEHLEISTKEAIYENINEGLNKNESTKSLDDTDDGSLEEFIRNEKEVSDSFKVNNDVKTEEVSNGTITNEVNSKFTSETYKELIHHHKSETSSNYCEKYTEVLTKRSRSEVISNREKDTETVPPEIVKQLKSQFQSSKTEVVGLVRKTSETKSATLINQIKTKFEGGAEGQEGKMGNMDDDSTEYTETIVESSAPGEVSMSIKKKKVKKTRKEEKENISVTPNGSVDGEYIYNVSVKNLKSSFSKFDALQKKNVLHVRSSDSTKAQEKFSNGAQIELPSNCRACGKQVFQMEQIKAEKAVWHQKCFRCTECSKQLTVDTYESNDGNLYCKPHFKALFAPKAVEEDPSPRPRKPELIIRENEPQELPPGVVRASDKPDLGLEELQSLNVKERFQHFEHFQSQHTETSDIERASGKVERSPSILSKLAKFQKHGMDIGVSNEALDGVPIEESESEEEEEEVPEGDDPDLVRARKVQKEKPFHFTGMSDVKKRWEQGDHAREERREETKQEIQNIRTRLFMGKQEKMKEAYQQAVMQSDSSANLRKNLSEEIEVCDTKSIKERFEKGEMANDRLNRDNRNEEEEVYESEISKKSRSMFLELDASASKPPQISPVTPPKLEVKKAREAYLEKTSKEDTVKSTEQVEEIEVRTAEIQERFKFFETYKEPQKEKRQFRITPPRDPSQVKNDTPEREIYRDPEVVRSEEYIDDSKVAQESHTASKMLNKFRQMEENLSKEPEVLGPKPLKCFTPPPEPARPESRSDEEEESSEYEEEDEDETDQTGKLPEDLIEAQKAARAKQLRAKFEKWEANEIKKEQNSVNVVEEFGEEQSQVESTRVIRAKFEQMRDSSNGSPKSPRVKPNRFVEISAAITETCQSCNDKVYPLEKISIHGNIYHKSCFKCMECSCILRMDSYSYNQGLLYCTPHFKRLFITKGNYDSAFGLDQHKEKWQNTVNNMTVA